MHFYVKKSQTILPFVQHLKRQCSEKNGLDQVLFKENRPIYYLF